MLCERFSSFRVAGKYEREVILLLLSERFCKLKLVIKSLTGTD